MQKLNDKKFFKNVKIIIDSVIGNDFKNNEMNDLFEILETKILTTSNIHFLYKFCWYCNNGEFIGLDKKILKALIYIENILNRYFEFNYTEVDGVIDALISIKNEGKKL